jgi:hypothetical protein
MIVFASGHDGLGLSFQLFRFLIINSAWIYQDHPDFPMTPFTATMSVREPFVPSHPASRASHDVVNKATGDNQPCSPPPQKLDAPNQPSQQDESVTAGVDTNKPLNISSLSKRRSSISKSQMHQKKIKNPLQMGQSLANSLSPSASQTSDRPRLVNHHHVNIAQPRPSSPSTFLSSLSVSEFKVPNIRSSKQVTRPQSTAPISIDDEQISTENAFADRPVSSMGFSSQVMTRSSMSVAASTPNAVSSHKFGPSNLLSYSASLDKINEVDEEEQEHMDHIRARAQIPFGHDGPRRVIAPSNEGIEGHAGQRVLRRSKRDRSLRGEEENEEEYGPTKRWKSGEGLVSR